MSDGNESSVVPIIEACQLANDDDQSPQADIVPEEENPVPIVVIAEDQAQREGALGTSTSSMAPPESPCVAFATLVEVTEIHPSSDTASSDHQPQAEYRSVTFPNKAVPQNLGMSLERDEEDESLRIVSIEDGCLMSRSPFCVGDKIISINTRRCHDIESDEGFIKSLRQIKGRVTIMAENPHGDPSLMEAMVVKATPQSKVGLHLIRKQRILQIGSVFPKGLFGQSVLNKGDRILTINGTECHDLGPIAANELIQNSPETVTIVTKRLGQTAVVMRQISSVHDNSEQFQEESSNQNDIAWSSWPILASARFQKEDVICYLIIAGVFVSIVLFLAFVPFKGK